MNEVFLSLLELEFEELNKPPPGNVGSFSSLAVFRAVASVGCAEETFLTAMLFNSSLDFCDVDVCKILLLVKTLVDPFFSPYLLN